MKKVLFRILLLSFLISSCNKKNEFFKLDLTIDKYGKKVEHHGKHQYIVMTKPHKNLDSLLIQVKNYIEHDNNYDSIIQSGSYEGFFYKETWNTPRDYKEDPNGYFTFDEIGHHIDDIIVSVSYRKCTEEGWKYKIKTHNNPDEWEYHYFTVDGKRK